MRGFKFYLVQIIFQGFMASWFVGFHTRVDLNLTIDDELPLESKEFYIYKNASLYALYFCLYCYFFIIAKRFSIRPLGKKPANLGQK